MWLILQLIGTFAVILKHVDITVSSNDIWSGTMAFLDSWACNVTNKCASYM